MELPNDKVLDSYKLYMTQIDGKILNILTDTNQAKLNQAICGATPLKFLNIQEFRSKEYTPKLKTLQYGISPLHSWIQFFECILHLLYRHGIEKWQIQDKNRQVFNEQKQEVQQHFWETMSLLVDKPKANSSGSTNNENMAQHAFSRPELFARITNVDQSLIHKCSILRNLKHSVLILLIYT